MQKEPVEVKEAVKAKVNEVKAVAAEKEAAAKEAVAKTVETTAKKAEGTVKRATRKTTAKKTTAKKAAKKEMVPEIVIQFNGNEGGVKNVVDKITAAYVAEGHRASSIKSMQVYLKPEEYAAYYVVNEKFAGRVDLF